MTPEARAALTERLQADAVARAEREVDRFRFRLYEDRPGLIEVRNLVSGGVYQVDLVHLECTCPWFALKLHSRQVWCKHILAAITWANFELRGEG